MDLPQLKLVQAGDLWFWDRADHDRAESHVDGTLEVLCKLVRAAAGPADADARFRTLALQFNAGYVIGLRDLPYERRTWPRRPASSLISQRNEAIPDRGRASRPGKAPVWAFLTEIKLLPSPPPEG